MDDCPWYFSLGDWLVYLQNCFLEKLIKLITYLKKYLYFLHCSSKLFFDEIYRFYVNRIQDPFCRFIEVMELLFISGLMVRGAAGISGLISFCLEKLSTLERFILIHFGSSLVRSGF